MNDVESTIWHILDLIGSAMPLAVLCFLISFIIHAKSFNKATLGAYIVMAILMFLLLLRT